MSGPQIYFARCIDRINVALSFVGKLYFAVRYAPPVVVRTPACPRSPAKILGSTSIPSVINFCSSCPCTKLEHVEQLLSERSKERGIVELLCIRSEARLVFCPKNGFDGAPKSTPVYDVATHTHGSDNLCPRWLMMMIGSTRIAGRVRNITAVSAKEGRQSPGPKRRGNRHFEGSRDWFT